MVIGSSVKMENIESDIVIQWLEEVQDPELPFLNIVEMGMVREAFLDPTNGEWCVRVTPTFLGCPALEVIKEEIKKNLENHGLSSIRIETVYAPVWTTEWLKEKTRQKLRDYGYAPPESHVQCPYCKSEAVKLVSAFGSTACKALWKCESCLAPFEQFKCR